MKIEILGININYIVSGVGPVIVMLHGWGSNLNTFDNLVFQLNDDHTIYQIDLPGFGESEIKQSYSLDEYSLILIELFKKLEIKNPIIIAHSFGGRVAIKIAANYPLKKLVLISTPGIKERFNLKKEIKIFLYKLFKKINLKLNTGSKDYNNSSELLKGVLVKAVNEDLSDSLMKITAPTLLVYGKRDKTVPLYIGKRINTKIQNSGLVIVSKCGHFPYIERYKYFLIILKSFLHSDSC